MQVRWLELRRFRRFETFTWVPSPGVNCIIGPGNSGKSALLDALTLLLSPSPGRPASEADYLLRQVEHGFEVEAWLGCLTPELEGLVRPPALWGWRGPTEPPRTAPVDSEPVLRVLVRGTPDLEIEHRLLTTDGGELPFSADNRRRVGLLHMGELRDTLRDLRMARGSLLERSLGREELRGAAAQAVREASDAMTLPQEVGARLSDLLALFRHEGVTDRDLSLQLLAPPGQNLLGMLGLSAESEGTHLPFAYAGQGTQRLAVFALATALASRQPIAVIDELEVGLEPYRQRRLIARLRDLVGDKGQAFITTHSSTVLAALRAAELRRVHWEYEKTEHEETPADPPRLRPRITALGEEVARMKADDPEALLCRLPVVCEGSTESILLDDQLRARARQVGLDLDALGIRLVDGRGQPNALTLADALRHAGMAIGAFLDEESKCQGRRQRLRDDTRTIYGSFAPARCTELALAEHCTIAELDALIDVHDPDSQGIGVSRRQQLGDDVNRPGVVRLDALAGEFDEDKLRQAWGETAHRRGWFKQRTNARALATHLAATGMPIAMQRAVDVFWESILQELAPAAARQSESAVNSGNGHR